MPISGGRSTAAEREGLSASGLAKKAGLNSTSFNPSKRASKTRKRWPSTESINQFADHDDLGALPCWRPGHHDADGHSIGQSCRCTMRALFNEVGHPDGDAWDKLRFPVLSDPHAFALEVGKGLGQFTATAPSWLPHPKNRAVAIVLFCASGKAALRLGSWAAILAERSRSIPLASPNTPLAIARNVIEWRHRIAWASQ